jgi:hypothetical protein
MKKTLAIVPVLALLMGFTSFAAQGLYGSWKLPAINQGPLSFSLSIMFAPNTMTLKNVCTFNGQTGEAQVTVPVTITGNTIVVSAPKEDQQVKNGVPCSVSVAASSMTYSVSADDAQLTLSSPGQAPIALSRQ